MDPEINSFFFVFGVKFRTRFLTRCHSYLRVYFCSYAFAVNMNSFLVSALLFGNDTNPAHPKHIGSIDPACNVADVVNGEPRLYLLCSVISALSPRRCVTCPAFVFQMPTRWLRCCVSSTTPLPRGWRLKSLTVRSSLIRLVNDSLWLLTNN